MALRGCVLATTERKCWCRGITFSAPPPIFFSLLISFLSHHLRSPPPPHPAPLHQKAIATAVVIHDPSHIHCSYSVLSLAQVLLVLFLNWPRPSSSLHVYAQNTDPNDQLHPAKRGRHPLIPTGARERGVRGRRSGKRRKRPINPIISTAPCALLIQKANPLTSLPSPECRRRRPRAIVVHSSSSQCCC